eukprot:581320_1
MPQTKASRARLMQQATIPKPKKPIPSIIHLEDITDDDIEIITEIATHTRKRKRLKPPNTSHSSPPKKKFKTKQIYPMFERKHNTSNTNHYPTNDPLLATLRQRFGFNSFRPSQKHAIQCILNHRDVLLLMPTGGGKSLCFQLPAVVLKKLVIVISPLIALMKNHCDALKRKGIKVKMINSTVSPSEKAKIYNTLSNNSNSIELLYTTPEQLTKNQTFSNLLHNMYRNAAIGMFAIDECHCISSWGHDFRPSYRGLHGLRRQYPNVPIMALTATATTRVRDDIIHNLQLHNPQILTSSFDRPNLYFEFRYIENLKAVRRWVKPKTSGKRRGKRRSRKVNKKEITKINQKISDDIFKFITKHRYERHCGIIYVFSRKDAETIAHYLKNEYKLSCDAYHAGFGNKKKVQIQENWQNNRTNVIVATCAFGMGIDQGNVRFVIHCTINKCLEEYYQEIGRAGRDRKSSRVLCYYSVNMLNKHRGIALKESSAKISKYAKRGKSKEQIKAMARNDARYTQIQSNLEYVQRFAEPSQCRRVILMRYFNEQMEDKGRSNMSCCDYCDDKQSINKMKMQYDKKRGVKRQDNDYESNQDEEHLNTDCIEEFDDNSNNSNNSNGSNIVLDVSSTRSINGLTIQTREKALLQFLGVIEENIKGRNDEGLDAFDISQKIEKTVLNTSNTNFVYGHNLRQEMERIRQCTQKGLLWNENMNVSKMSVNHGANDMEYEMDVDTDCMSLNTSLNVDGAYQLAKALEEERYWMLDMLDRRSDLEAFNRNKKKLDDVHTPKVNQLSSKYESDLVSMEGESNVKYTMEINIERQLLVSLVRGYNPNKRRQMIWNSEYEQSTQMADRCDDLTKQRMEMIQNRKRNKCDEEAHELEEEDDDLLMLSLDKNHQNVKLLMSMGFHANLMSKAWYSLKGNAETKHIQPDHQSFITRMLDKMS